MRITSDVGKRPDQLRGGKRAGSEVEERGVVG
jgi:hypothetical protein